MIKRTVLALVLCMAGGVHAADCRQNLEWSKQLKKLTDGKLGLMASTYEEQLIEDSSFIQKVRDYNGFAADLFEMCIYIQDKDEVRMFLKAMEFVADKTGIPIGPYMKLMWQGSEFVLDELQRVVTRVAPAYFVTNPAPRFTIQLNRYRFFRWDPQLDANKYIDSMDIVELPTYGASVSRGGRKCPDRSAFGECNNIADPKSYWMEWSVPAEFLESQYGSEFSSQYFLRIKWKNSELVRFDPDLGVNLEDKQTSLIPLFVGSGSSTKLNPIFKTKDVRGVTLTFILKNGAFLPVTN